MTLRVYSRGGKVAHLLRDDDPFGPALCGRPSTQWWGMGDAGQVGIASRMPTCKSCARADARHFSHRTLEPQPVSPPVAPFPDYANAAGHRRADSPKGPGAEPLGRKVLEGVIVTAVIGLLTKALGQWPKAVNFFDGDPWMAFFFLWNGASGIAISAIVVRDLINRRRAQQKVGSAGNYAALGLAALNLFIAAALFAVASGTWA